MKRETRSLIAALGGLVFVVMMIAPAVWGANEARIVGFVISSECLLRSVDGQEYAIAIDKMGVDLMREDRKKVEVRGTVEEREGEKVINVEKYTVMK